MRLTQDQKGCDSGVYAIRNTITGRTYVGSTKHIAHRWSGHCTNFRAGTHTPDLQKDWDQYGPESFVLKVLEELPNADQQSLLDAEQRWITRMTAESSQPLYNMRPAFGEKMVKVPAVMHPDTVDRLDVIAKKTHTTRSVVFRDIIKIGLDVMDRRRIAIAAMESANELPTGTPAAQANNKKPATL